MSFELIPVASEIALCRRTETNSLRIDESEDCSTDSIAEEEKFASSLFN